MNTLQFLICVMTIPGCKSQLALPNSIKRLKKYFTAFMKIYIYSANRIKTISSLRRRGDLFILQSPEF